MGDPAGPTVTEAAFRALHAAAEARLAGGLLTVIDATNIDLRSRDPLLEMAWYHRRPMVAIVFAPSLEQCLDWNDARPGRRVPPRVVRAQYSLMRRAVADMVDQGFGALYQLKSVAAIDSVSVLIDGR